MKFFTCSSFILYFAIWLFIKTLLVEIKKIFSEIFERCVKILQFSFIHGWDWKKFLGSMGFFIWAFFKCIISKLLILNELGVVLNDNLNNFERNMKQNQCGYHLQKRFHFITKVPSKCFSRILFTVSQKVYPSIYVKIYMYPGIGRWFEIMSRICYILRKMFLDRKSIGSKGRQTNTRIDTFQNCMGLLHEKGNPEALPYGTVIILDH